MTVLEQLHLATQFMILGMGVVFVFLTILIFVVKWMGFIIQKIESSKPAPEQTQSTSAGGRVTIQNDVVASVIGAAIHQYQRDRR